MTYSRVIPRDLFNEANLLKCLGQVYLNLETLNLPHVALEHDGGAFDVYQNTDDGSLVAVNVVLNIGHPDPYTDCIERCFFRPLNSRQPWPLYTSNRDGEEIAVFNDDGTFTTEFVAFLHTKME